MPFIRNVYRLIIDGYIVIHILLIVITQFLCISSCYDFLTLNLNTLDNFSCFLFLKSTLFVLSKVIVVGKLVFVNSRANTFPDIPEVVYTCYKGVIHFSNDNFSLWEYRIRHTTEHVLGFIIVLIKVQHY